MTAEFYNVPLDTAVDLLADHCGLRHVRFNNTLYVVDEASHARMIRDRERKFPREDAEKSEPTGPEEPKRVAVKLEGETVLEALQRVGKEAGVTVVAKPDAKGLDLRPKVDLGERTVGDAAAVLADMAGLATVEIGDLVYITTPDAAERLRAERPAKKSAAADASDKKAGKK